MKKQLNEDIEFFVKNDNYFSTLAAVLELNKKFFDSAIEEINSLRKKYGDQIKILRNDLLYLQKNYKITAKKTGR